MTLPRHVELWIEPCPRCGKGHRTTFTKLWNRIGAWTHFGLCEETGEPILAHEWAIRKEKEPATC